MLYDQYGISALCEPLQDFNKLVYIGGVKSRCRFVEDIERSARCTFGKLGRKLYSLRFAALESC